MPALKLRMPVCEATAAAVLALSPVSIQTSIPCPASAATASAEPGFSLSVIAIAAHALELSANHTTVLAPASIAAASFSRAAGTGMPFASRSFLFPAKYVVPSYLPFTPSPVILSNPSILTFPASCRYFTTASANGCSESRSRPARMPSNTFFLSGTMSQSQLQEQTSGRPSVNVPVLSNTSTSTFLATSRLSASLSGFPFRHLFRYRP